MRVYSIFSLSLLTAMLLSSLTASAGPSLAEPEKEYAAMQRAQQAQQQQQQQQQQRAQQEAMQQMQAKQQQERVQQEQAMRSREEQARKIQMQAMQAQQDQARKMQQQQQQVQQDQARKVQQQQQQAQQDQARKMQQQQQQVQQEQVRKLQAQQQEQMRNSQKENFARGESAAQRPQVNPASNRPFKAKQLSVSAVPIEKAVPQPVLEPNAHPGEQDHSKAVAANLQRHLFAVAGAQAPQNRKALINNGRNHYFNNYSIVVNNRRISINRENTRVNYIQQNQYPTWYQPQPNWVMANGFTLGNDFNCGLDWLQWGWHPYYGPPPEGFVCSDDWFPTPWIFIPAYGVWRQPCEFAYSPAGPPYDYTGPISVEVLEPRHVHTRDPYSGWVNDRVINVVYFYNAFYYPDADRWGYMNRHGYFIWLNLDPGE